MHQFLALTSPGIEVLLADEIKSLGGENVTQKPEGVYFSGSSSSRSIGSPYCL